MVRSIPLAVALAGLAVSPVLAQRGRLPAPDVADERYGPHERNVLDLWKAKAGAPTPLVVYIHGGGFRGGDKRTLSPALLAGLLERGISVAAIHYRLSQTAPFPAPFEDSARAIQYLRHQAADWNLDPERFGATGGSAGAGISLWLGFKDDMAVPESGDPVRRRSTRLSAMAVTNGQTSYDPRWIREHINAKAAAHPALAQLYGLPPDRSDTPEAHAMYEAASPIRFLSADDPPALLVYGRPDEPITEETDANAGIHHARFGTLLKKEMDALGIECAVVAGARRGSDGEVLEFLARHLLRPE